MFRPLIPYEQAVFSDDPHLQELSRSTARERSKRRGPVGFNFAARGAFRENNGSPVYSGGIASQGSDLGVPLHPDRTTEYHLYNLLNQHPDHAEEWRKQGFKYMNKSQLDLKKMFSTAQDAEKELGPYRKYFKNAGYKSKLFSELHPCTNRGGCEEYLKTPSELNNILEVYHSVPYATDNAYKMQAAHKIAIEALNEKGIDLLNPVRPVPAPQSPVLGRFPTHVPAQIPLSAIMESPAEESVVNVWGQPGLPRSSRTVFPLEETKDDRVKPPQSAAPDSYGFSFNPEYVDLEQMEREYRNRNRDGSPKPDHLRSASTPPSLREDYDSSLRSRPHSPMGYRESSPLRSPSRGINPVSSAQTNWRLDSSDEEYFKRGGPVTARKPSAKKSSYRILPLTRKGKMNIFERMLLGYL